MRLFRLTGMSKHLETSSQSSATTRIFHSTTLIKQYSIPSRSNEKTANQESVATEEPWLTSEWVCARTQTGMRVPVDI